MGMRSSDDGKKRAGKNQSLKQIDEKERRKKRAENKKLVEEEDKKTHMKSYKAGATCRYEP